MYSQIAPPPGVVRVRVKPGFRALLVAGELCCAPILKHTWAVWNRETLLVEVLFHMEPNGHGWSPPEAHARSYMIRRENFNPFELDSIP